VAVTAECFCGCGRVLQGQDAKLSEKQGVMVVQLLDALEAYSLPMLEGNATGVPEARANVESLISDGQRVHSDLAAVVHGELGWSDFDRRGAKRWIKTSAKIATQSIKTLDHEMERQRIGPYEE
jgi:hypothetical protein